MDLSQEMQGNPSDEELLERMGSGDVRAFVEVIRRHATWLAVLARRVMGPEAVLEDIQEVVNDVFLEIWNRRDEYDPTRSAVKTWMSWRLIAQARPRQRAARRYQDAQTRAIREFTLESVTEGPEHAVDKLNANDQLRRAFLVLYQTSPADTDLLIRRYFRQETPAEISSALGISNGTARTRLTRARQHLRRICEDLEMEINTKIDGEQE